MVRVLYLIENGSFRFDHRTRREVCSLRDAGCKVRVICPTNKGESVRETMVTGGDVCEYVESVDPPGLANLVMRFAVDPKQRQALGQSGRKRVENVRSWPHQTPNLIRISNRFFSGEFTASEIPCA